MKQITVLLAKEHAIVRESLQDAGSGWRFL
jgi:hypothetical protein